MRVTSISRVCFVAVLVSGALQAHATTYYVSPSGSDLNNGVSPSTSWLTLNKVNRTAFAPGDRILLAAGGTWNEQLWPKGSGMPGNSITVDMYGPGRRPVINGLGNRQGAVLLWNQHDWIIQNLEVTNTSATPGPSTQLVGVQVMNATGGLLSHLTIKNVYVHDVNGFVGGVYSRNAGIAVNATDNMIDPSAGPNSYWSDVTIQGCRVEAVDRIGIYVGPDSDAPWSDVQPSRWPELPKSSVITIADNIVNNTGADGILGFVVQDLLVTNNVVSSCGNRLSAEQPPNVPYFNGAAVAMWTDNSLRATFQYNEVYGFMMNNPHNTSGDPLRAGDGQAFDADQGSVSTTFQYNYSHDNRSGMLQVFDSGGTLAVSDLKVRFNVSYRDHEGVFFIPVALNTGSSRGSINNNLVYAVDPSRIFGLNVAANGHMDIYNNIFFYSVPPPATAYFPLAPGADITFDANTYFVASGSHPSDEPGLPGNPPDPHKSIADPRLACATCPSTGWPTLEGLRLLTGSPALATGVDKGAATGAFDLWRNPLATGGPRNRGMYAGPGIAAPTVPNLAFLARVTPSSTYDVPPWSSYNLVDGQPSSIAGFLGYSSAVGNPTNHTESVVVDLGVIRTFDKVVLYPRSDAGNVGAGFPVNFTIQVWDGANWITRVTQTGYPQPGGSGQVFTWGFPDRTNLIKIEATSLRPIAGDYLLQFAELQVFDTNQVLAASVTSDSSYEADGWSASHVVDGVRGSLSWSMGYSSGVANAGSNHTETLYLTTPYPQSYSSLVLFPRSDAGLAGEGFPIDFTIAFWNGSSWDVKVTRTAYPKPGATGQVFTWGSSVITTRIRIQASNLRPVQGLYVMQFAEVEAYP